MPIYFLNPRLLILDHTDLLKILKRKNVTEQN